MKMTRKAGKRPLETALIGSSPKHLRCQLDWFRDEGSLKQLCPTLCRKKTLSCKLKFLLRRYISNQQLLRLPEVPNSCDSVILLPYTHGAPDWVVFWVRCTQSYLQFGNIGLLTGLRSYFVVTWLPQTKGLQTCPLSNSFSTYSIHGR